MTAQHLLLLVEEQSMEAARDRVQAQGRAGLHRAISSLGSGPEESVFKNLCLARSLSAIGERFRTNSCEFGSLGEAGCMSVSDEASSKMPTGWKDWLIPGNDAFSFKL